MIGTDLSRDQCAGGQACVDIDQARQTIKDRGVLVYSIFTGVDYEVGGGKTPRECWKSCWGVGTPASIIDGPLKSLAKQTGGFASTQHVSVDMAPGFARSVLEEMRQRYLIAYGRDEGAPDDVKIRVSASNATVRVHRTQPAVR
jgi:hypothetical protein